jgi:hypothetical protein
MSKFGSRGWLVAMNSFFLDLPAPFASGSNALVGVVAL